MSAEIRSEVFALWEELAAIPASRTADALTHLMRWFHRNLDADNVIWLGSLLMLDARTARTDPLCGWRLRARKSFVPERESYRKLVASYFANEHYGRLTPAFYRKGNGPEADVHVGTSSRVMCQHAGKFRVYRLRDGWIDYAAFRRTEHFRLYYTENKIFDRIWIGAPVTPTSESIILVDRHEGKGRKPFTQRDADLVGTVLRGIPAFHRRLLMLHGVYKGFKPLTPLKTRILEGLLTGRSEKEIAAALGQKPMTMRKYVKEIYREFGVATRPMLMALWLGE
ncbi:MAG: LuxR family transcriptional regulator [Verrucomicrobia bacterium]|nr:LuxR family transcriptional regulator [Verrucomicrobiota bacterium]